MKTTIWILVSGLLAAAAFATEAPPILNYQGMIAVDGIPFDGAGLFRFALVDTEGTGSYWSNDGTSRTGDEPATAVPLTVSGGRYSVALGDTSLANMTAAIPTSVFADNADVRLRVWFDDGVNGSQLLSPDQRLGAVGYAFAASSVAAGAVGAEQLAAGAVTTAALADGTVTSAKIATGTVIPAQTIAGTSQTATANTSYTATSDSLTTIDLSDTVADVGDTVQISGAGTGGWVASLYQPDQWTARESIRLWESVASSADGNKLVAVVNGGQIYTSTDSGVSWTAQTEAGSRDWVSVASSADGSKLVAAVSGGQIYTSTDSGVSWTAQPDAGSRNWVSVASSADGSKLAAAVYGTQIYTSTDSGESWTAQPGAGIRLWESVASSADGNKLVAVVSGGQIYTSTDSGVSWTARESNRDWRSVASSADGTYLVAAVHGGQIYTSTDSGVNWLPRDSDRNWTAVASSADGSKLVAVVDNGQIYTSTDSGESWTARESSREWRSVASSADGSKLVAVVDDGKIYTSGTVAVGAQGSSTTLQYLGNGQWVPVQDVASDDADADPSNELQNLAAVLSEGTDAGGAGMSNLGAVSATSFTGDGSGLTNLPGDNLGNHTATENIQLNSHWLSGDGGDEGVFVDGSGRVGIGTASPEQTLHVVGQAQIQDGNLHFTTQPASQLNHAVSTISVNQFGDAITPDPTNQSMTFEVSDGTLFGTTEVMTLRGDGNVGIGTGSPDALLDVDGTVKAGTVTTGSESTSQAASTVHAGDGFLVTPWVYANAIEAPGERNSQSTLITIGNDGTYGANDQIHLVTGGQSRVAVTTAPGGVGRVGIGRTAFLNAFEVEGNASKSVAGSWLANSDRRIKEDIREVDHALETLDRVRLVSFEYTEDYRASHPGVGEGRYLNVVAQEFAEVFPDHVKPSGELLDGEPILQVDTYPLTIYAAAAVQELNRKLGEKDAEMRELKETVAELKQLVESLARERGHQ